MEMLNDYLKKYPEYRKTIINFYASYIEDLKKGLDEKDAKARLLNNLKIIDNG